MACTPPPVAAREYRDWAIEPSDDREYLGTTQPEEGIERRAVGPARRPSVTVRSVAVS